MDEQRIAAIHEYINEHFAVEDDALRWIQEETRRQEMPAISIQPFEGRLLQFLAQLMGARKIAEIGTLGGYSGTWMARALPADGRLYTVEISSKHAQVARQGFERAGVGDRVIVYQGDATQMLHRLNAHAPFDMVFIDADKESYPHYLEWAIVNVRIGGLITAHNALRGGGVIDPQNDGDRHIAAFNQQVAEDPRLDALLIGVGDGMLAAIRRG